MQRRESRLEVESTEVVACIGPPTIVEEGSNALGMKSRTEQHRVAKPWTVVTVARVACGQVGATEAIDQTARSRMLGATSVLSAVDMKLCTTHIAL